MSGESGDMTFVQQNSSFLLSIFMKQLKFSVKLSASSTLVAHSKEITCLDVSANDRLCVTGSMDKTAKLWHIDTRKMQLGIAGSLQGHRRGVWDARFCDSTQVCFMASFTL